MRFFVFFLLVIIPLLVIGQPTKMNSGLSNRNIEQLNGPVTLNTPCPTPSCPECIDDCVTNCNIGACLACIDANCPEDIPIDGGFIWLIIAGIALKTGQVVRRKKGRK